MQLNVSKSCIGRKSISVAVVTECQAMFDGRKRGFSVLQVAVTALSARTGKCHDYESLNIVCYDCSKWEKFVRQRSKAEMVGRAYLQHKLSKDRK